MSKLYTKFTFKDYQGKDKVYEIHKRDLKTFKINLLEASFVKDIGPVYVFNEEEQEWHELDYYND